MLKSRRFPMARRIARGLAAAILPALIHSSLLADQIAIPQSRAAIVTSVRGNCVRVRDHKRLQVGDMLTSEDAFEFAKPRSTTDYIDLMLPNGRVTPFDCYGMFSCLRTYRPPIVTARDPIVEELMKARTLILPAERDEIE